MPSSVMDVVSRQISPGDAMFEGNLEHYFWVGESALNNVLSALDAAGTSPKKILDFGAGAGRVTRWLVAAFPEAEIHARDVRDEDMNFVRQTFGAKAETVNPDLNALKFADRYDLIWVGSVITHLSAPETKRLVKKLFSRLEPKGVLVASFHGRHAVDLRGTSHIVYIENEAWQKVKKGYFATGYGYADYRGETGYGISATSRSWIVALIKSLRSCRLLHLTEGGWADHHDVFAIQRIQGPDSVFRRSLARVAAKFKHRTEG